MRVATVDGLVTLFYDGSKELWNRELHFEYRSDCIKGNDIESLNISDECKSYLRERLSWQQIIVVDGVTDIPEQTFSGCLNIKKVIFSNTVIRIHGSAFYGCKNLVYIKWSLHLRYIGNLTFRNCNLSSVFIPPRCRHIGDYAFACNENLSILNVSQNVELSSGIISQTALLEASPFTRDYWFYTVANENMNRWLKNMNNENQFALHRACASFQPQKEVIREIIVQEGPEAFGKENSAGITPSRYLQKNPYTELSEKEIIRDYVMKMMGDIE